MTFPTQSIIMETKTKGFVSNMRDAIIEASIESLRQEGLRFSVDTLSDKMKISKKTVYKYFPDKEALATAIYERYYLDVTEQAQKLIAENTKDSHRGLLRVYFDTKVMTRSSIFNKYKLNRAVYAYTTEKSDLFWELISDTFNGEKSDTDKDALRIIVDGSFEKLCNAGASSDAVIERLARLLW